MAVLVTAIHADMARKNPLKEARIHAIQETPRLRRGVDAATSAGMTALLT